MRKIFRTLASGVLLFGLSVTCSTVFAQEGAEKAAEKAGEPASEGEHGGLEIWKWANFALLAGGLGYLAAKNAGPFFDARSRQIRKDMIEADDLRKQAEARSAEVERRLANLEAEIAALRADSQRETQAETERLSKYAIAEIAKVQAHSQQEIVAAGKAARLELQRYSAHIAISLAEQKIRARMSAATQDVLVQNFVRKLQPPAARAD